MAFPRIVIILVLWAGCAVTEAARVQAPFNEAEVSRHSKKRRESLCSDLTRRKDCLDGLKHADCAWCESDQLATCLTPEAAYALEGSAKCEGARPPRKARCDELLSRKDCLRGSKQAECAWCKSDDFDGCLTPEAAYSLEGTAAAKCEGAHPPKRATCSDLLTKRDCLDSAAIRDDSSAIKDDSSAAIKDDSSVKKKKHRMECAWCQGPSMSGSCLDAEAASFIGEDLAKCRGASLPDKPCKDLKKGQCLRGNVDGPCAWCKGGYMRDKCMDEQEAKFLPEFVAKCKFGSDKKEKKKKSGISA